MPVTQEQGGLAEHHMYRPPQQQEPQVTLDDIIGRFKTGMPRIPGLGGGGASLIVFVFILVIAVIWGATGIYTVGPDQEGALRLFGRYTDIAEEGLHWWWPAPIGTRNVVAVTTTRRMELGFRGGGEGLNIAQAVPVESMMITGDENIVDVQVVIQYRIGSLQNFLFEVDDPGDPDRAVPQGNPEGRTLRDIAETAVRQVVGARPIDDVLTTQREQIQTDVLELMRRLNDIYKTGITVQQVLLQNVNPPAEVQDAFEDVVRAQEDRDRVINLAQAYEADQIPKALGAAARITEEAQGFKDGRIARALGEADGFNAILEGYKGSPEVTRRRLYLEAMEQILPGVKKFVLSDQGVLPFLPLDGSTSQSGTAPTGGSAGGQP